MSWEPSAPPRPPPPSVRAPARSALMQISSLRPLCWRAARASTRAFLRAGLAGTITHPCECSVGGLVGLATHPVVLAGGALVALLALLIGSLRSTGTADGVVRRESAVMGIEVRRILKQVRPATCRPTRHSQPSPDRAARACLRAGSAEAGRAALRGHPVLLRTHASEAALARGCHISARSDLHLGESRRYLGEL